MSEQQDGRPWWRRLLTRGGGLLVTGIALYVVAPSLLALLDAVPSLGDVGPVWFFVVVGRRARQLRVAVGAAADRVAHQGLVRRRGVAAGGQRGEPGACPAARRPAAWCRAGCWCGRATRSAAVGAVLSATGLLTTGMLFALPRARRYPPCSSGWRCPVRWRPGCWCRCVLAGAAGRGRRGGALVGPGRHGLAQRGRLGGDQVRAVAPAGGWPAGWSPSGTGSGRRSTGTGCRRCRPPPATGCSTWPRWWRRCSRSGADANPFLVLLAYVVSLALALVPITPGGLGFRRGRPDQPAGAGRGDGPGGGGRRRCSTGWRRSGCRSRSGWSPGAGGGPAGVPPGRWPRDRRAAAAGRDRPRRDDRRRRRRRSPTARWRRCRRSRRSGCRWCSSPVGRRGGWPTSPSGPATPGWRSARTVRSSTTCTPSRSSSTDPIPVEVGLEVARRLRAAVPGQRVRGRDARRVRARAERTSPRWDAGQRARDRAAGDDLRPGRRSSCWPGTRRWTRTSCWPRPVEAVGDLVELTHSSTTALLEISAAGVSKASGAGPVRGPARGRRGRRGGVRRHAQRPADAGLGRAAVRRRGRAPGGARRGRPVVRRPERRRRRPRARAPLRPLTVR